MYFTRRIDWYGSLPETGTPEHGTPDQGRPLVSGDTA
jgi:hypothetical protein